MSTLVDSQRFIDIANLVARHGIKLFVEPSANRSMAGAEMAARLGLQAYICESDWDYAVEISRQYPDFDVYDYARMEFLKEVLPKLWEPTFFWIDPQSSTRDKEIAMIEASAGEMRWFYDLKPGQFDRSEQFDTNWVGPTDMKPRCYRTQSEKDTWYSVAVENEYELGDLRPSDVVIDIGAHIGSFAWLAHRKGSRNIWPFEIDPWHVAGAEQNLAGLDGIRLCHTAVVRSDDKRRPLYHYDGGWHPFSTEGVPLESVSLDEILELFPVVRFLKTDCEGSEWSILYTSKQLHRVMEIAGEYHESVPPDDSLPPQKIESLAEFLREKGFAVSWKQGAPRIGNFYARRIVGPDRDHPGKNLSLGN